LRKHPRSIDEMELPVGGADAGVSLRRRSAVIAGLDPLIHLLADE
jgi:hypothetical protein